MSVYHFRQSYTASVYQHKTNIETRGRYMIGRYNIRVMPKPAGEISILRVDTESGKLFYF